MKTKKKAIIGRLNQAKVNNHTQGLRIMLKHDRKLDGFGVLGGGSNAFDRIRVRQRGKVILNTSMI